MITASEVVKEFELRVFDESYSRIENCLSKVSQEELWSSPNPNIISIGCLVKHLLGNMQQWLYKGVLDEKYTRNRDAEFIANPDRTQEDLVKEMKNVREMILPKLRELKEDKLTVMLEIQGFEVTGYSAISHVIEHFSYHTGQIALLTKLHVNQDLGFYDGYDLN